MKRFVLLSSVVLLFSTAVPAVEPLQWVKRPELTFDEKAKKWYATFELDALTDVEVALIVPVKNTVIRHLAAGVLGPKAPPPLMANSRAQKLEWDGKDDYRVAVPKPESLAVRVRAGMGVKIEKIVGGDLYAYWS